MTEAEQLASKATQTANSMEMSHRKVKNSLTREQIIDRYQGILHSEREILLPKMESYEQARNRGLEILKDVDWASGKPYFGKFESQQGKIVGREWHSRYNCSQRSQLLEANGVAVFICMSA